MSRGKLKWTDAAVCRFKERVRAITKRSNGKSMWQRIPELYRYVTGWLNYYGHCRSYTQLLELDQWLRRRVRLCYWKQWRSAKRNWLPYPAAMTEGSGNRPRT